MNRLGLTVAGLALVAVGWFLLAPTVLGGGTTYVFTSGISMQPRLHTGDLVVVRAAPDYRVGDIVAYRSRTMDTLVLHRIVARDGPNYVFKGDNNSFLDPEHPTRSDLVGRLWFQAPALGTTFPILRTPGLALPLAALGILLLIGGGARARHRRRPTQRASQRAPRLRLDGEAATLGCLVAVVALAGFLTLATLAFSRSTVRDGTSPSGYAHEGSFAYTADAPVGAVYPDGRADTGDPLFVRLIDRIDVRFDYRLTSDAPHAVRGSASLRAELAASNGWARTLELQPPARFDGDRVAVSGVLDVRAVERLLRQVETELGESGVAYTLTLVPDVRVDGHLAGVELSDTFAPRLALTWNANQLRLEGVAPAAAESAAATADPYARSTAGQVQTARREAATLSLRGRQVSVTSARVVSLVGVGLALVALVGCLVLRRRAGSADEPSRIQVRHRELLIPVARTEHRSYDELVELTSFDALARLAQRYNRMVLHQQTPLGHAYRMVDEGVLYIYLIGDDRGLLPRIPPPTSPAAAADAARPSRWTRR